MLLGMRRPLNFHCEYLSAAGKNLLKTAVGKKKTSLQPRPRGELGAAKRPAIRRAPACRGRGKRNWKWQPQAGQDRAGGEKIRNHQLGFGRRRGGVRGGRARGWCPSADHSRALRGPHKNIQKRYAERKSASWVVLLQRVWAGKEGF